MKLSIITICLDAMPWVSHHLSIFNRLKCDWTWTVVEGAAMNVRCTAWCKPQEPRLSADGTTEYLNGLKQHPRVVVIQRPSWDGKLEMVNAALALITEPCVLLQVDADELWDFVFLEFIVEAFRADPELALMNFGCRYFVGPNIITAEKKPSRWQRAWRFTPGMTFDRHEPPTLAGNLGKCVESDLQFDHMSYVMESQVAAKEKFYGYKDAVKHWRRLQENTEWPVKRLTDFLPWSGKHSSADLFMKPEPLAMPSLDQILTAGKTQTGAPEAAVAPPPITASQAHKNRAGPFPKPLVRRFLIVIGFYDGDHDAAQDLANLIFDLQQGRNADTDILFYHRNDARAMEPAIVEKMKLKFLRVFTHRCPRINAKGHPYGCNEMWYSLVEMMKAPKWLQDYYAYYNMEPDCVPLEPEWIEKLSAEFRRQCAEGFAAMGHIKENPIRHLNGAAVYANDFYDRGGGLNLVGGSSTVGYDTYHAKRILPVSVDTPLMGGRWGIQSITDDELWAYEKDPENPVVVFHGGKTSSARDAVRRRWLVG